MELELKVWEIRSNECELRLKKRRRFPLTLRRASNRQIADSHYIFSPSQWFALSAHQLLRFRILDICRIVHKSVQNNLANPSTSLYCCIWYKPLFDLWVLLVFAWSNPYLNTGPYRRNTTKLGLHHKEMFAPSI